MEKNIICESISKEFPGDGFKTLAIHNIDLIFRHGQFTSIVGTSGSGKSTLLSILGTLDNPTSGTLRFGETAIGKMKAKKLADFRFENIGFIFQQFHLLPSLTSLENVMAPLFTRKVPYDKKQRAEEMLEKVGLSDKRHSLPSQLSGGQQQRVAIARALVHEPSWLLADEPTGNLDSENSEMIYDILSTLNKDRNCGIIMVTHDPLLASKGDRIIEMKDGCIFSDRQEVRV